MADFGSTSSGLSKHFSIDILLHTTHTLLMHHTIFGMLGGFQVVLIVEYKGLQPKMMRSILLTFCSLPPSVLNQIQHVHIPEYQSCMSSLSKFLHIESNMESTNLSERTYGTFTDTLPMHRSCSYHQAVQLNSTTYHSVVTHSSGQISLSNATTTCPKTQQPTLQPIHQTGQISLDSTMVTRLNHR